MAEIYYAKYSVISVPYNHRNPDSQWSYYDTFVLVGFQEPNYTYKYSSYEFVEGEGFKTTGEWGPVLGQPGSYGYYAPNTSEVRLVEYDYSWIEDDYVYIRYKVYSKKCEYDIRYEKGSFIEVVLAEEGAFPDDGMHTDGYWYISFIPEYLGVVELGTMYHDGVAQPLPTGDNPIIVRYSDEFERYIIGNTSNDQSKRIRWHKIRSVNGVLLICDRVLIKGFNPKVLEENNLISGNKVINIDNKEYKIRLLTGGKTNEDGKIESGNIYGKIPNEWDFFISNLLNIQGLPTPSPVDLSTSADRDKQIITPHNKFWNWVGSYTICQEKISAWTTSVVCRGHMSAKYWHYVPYDTTVWYESNGWRPVLEVMWEPPDISLNINGSLKKYDNGWVKVNGQLKEIDQIWVKANGALKEV